MRPPVWAVTATAAALCVLTGALGTAEAGEVTRRLLPVLAFLVAVTILADLAEAAGVFDVAAIGAARAARGRTPVLFALLFGLGVVTTVVLSLDTTAVLLTPVVLAVAQRVGLNPWPFALAVVWTANTASLLLPVSNLTNLLAADSLGVSPGAYVRTMALPAVAAVAVTALVLAGLHGRHLRSRYEPPAKLRPPDRVLYAGTAACCTAMVPLLLAGVGAAWAAGAAAAPAVALFAWRRPQVLHPRLVPWRLVLGVEAMFLLVQTAGPHGLDATLAHAVGSDLQTAFAAAGSANLANNLPAYLALERAVLNNPGPDHLLPVLLGVNLGPLILPWGSLATLLWAARCRSRGVAVSWRAFVLSGALLVPLLLLATVPLL